jgi:hypothetical protein
MITGPSTRRRKITYGLMAGAIAGVLAGCGMTGGKATPPPSSTSHSAPPTTTQHPSTLAFGSTFTYTDGLKVQVTQPVIFTPSSTAAGVTPGDTAVKFNIVITNGTNKTFDTAEFIVHLKAGAQGSEASIIVDTGIDSNFTGSIVSGSKDTTAFAYDVPRGSTNKLDVEVQPGFNYNSAHWVGAAR